MNTREMVDSKVEWIGNIPDYWKVSRIGDNFLIGAGISAPLDAKIFNASLIPFVRVSDLSRQDSKFITNTRDGVPLKYKNYIRKEGTIVFPKSGESIRSGIRKMLSSPCVVVSHLACMQAKRTLEKMFALWLMETINFEEQINQTALPALNLSQISRKEIPLPPLDEQQSIANFLDHHVNLIDREASLIDKKIELLGEKRKALIFECVTGKRTVVQRSSLTDSHNVVGHGDLVGVSTDPEKMMDSGVEWIGDIPDDWTVEQLKNIATVQVGKTPSTSNPEYFDGDIPWLTISDLKDDGTFPVSTKKTLSKIGSMGLNISPKGSVLVSFKLSVGKSTIAERDIYTNEAIATISPKQNYSNIFFYWSLPDCFYNEASENIYGAKILNQDKIHHIKVVLPLKKQQEIISKFLDYEISMIDKEISLLKQKQDLLVEKRKALIFEAVTGKFDCHSWTA